MATATLTSKGQITLPKPVREHLGIHEGDRVDFMIRDDGSVAVRSLKGSIHRLAGLLARPGLKAPTIEEMKESIARFHAEDNERIRRQG